MDINVRNCSLQRLFAEIEKKTSYTFFYDVTILKDSKPVSVEARSATVPEILDRALAGQELEYIISERTIFIKRQRKMVEPPVALSTGVAAGAPVKVTGIVLTEAGAPVQGANVVIKQTAKGTITNAKGEFTLPAVLPGQVLVFTFVGYAPQNYTVKDASPIKIIMRVAQDELDKAVVQAYGTTTQRLTTADIGKVTAEEIERQPVMNPLLALQGKVAGLDVVQTSGYASGPIKVELRGRAMINDAFPSDPLYIIDGVPLTVLELTGQSSYENGSMGFAQSGNTGPANGQSPLFSINPNDIESIEVLKDADATAIYGSRGANGVILITTKKGKPGKTRFNLRLDDGLTHVTRYYPMMNTRQYLAMRREALANDGLAVDPIKDFDINGVWDTTRFTNWQKVLYGGLGRKTGVQTSLSGGDAHTTFRLSGGYDYAAGITTVSGGDLRITGDMSVSHRSANQHFTIEFASTYSYTRSDMINLPGSVTMAPDAPPIFDSLGNLNFSAWGGSVGDIRARMVYPFSGLKQPYSASTIFFNTHLRLAYQVAGGLALSVGLGYNSALTNQSTSTLLASEDPIYNPAGGINLGISQNRNWIAEPQLTYDARIGGGVLNCLLGASMSEANASTVAINAYGFSSDLFIQNLANAPYSNLGNAAAEYRYAGVFARVNYNWNSKYVLNINARRDGSSRFGPGRQYGDFASLGAAWIVSDESWVKTVLPAWLSFIKFRGSYGTTGTDAAGDYLYLSRYSPNGYRAYDNIASLAPMQAPNPDFEWQVNKKLEAALNLGFVRDRVNVQVAWYRDRSGNQLINFPTANFTGFPSTFANSPALVQNTGLEFTVAAKLVEVNNFSWSINFNTAINRNKLVAYPNFDQSPYIGVYQIGRPLNIRYKLHCVGVDPQTGQYAFQDRNHDGWISGYPYNATSDYYPIDLTPRFFGGAGMNFRYRSLALSFFLNIKSQLGRNSLAYGDVAGRLNLNQPTGIVGKEWKQPGQTASVAKFSTIGGEYYLDFYGISDGGYTDASFIRLSNLSVSYILPAAYLRRLAIESGSLFVSTNNLFIITKFKGIDPETQNFGGLPPTKTIALGMTINF